MIVRQKGWEVRMDDRPEKKAASLYGSSISRRGFMTAAGGLAVGALYAAEKKKVIEKLAVQLYTVRDVLPEDPRATLKRIAEIGYQEVEVLSPGFKELAPLFSEFSLEPVMGHFEAPLVTGNWKPWIENIGAPREGYNWEQAVKDAKEHGMRYMVISYLKPEERGGLDYFKSFADKMNKAGEVCRSAGLRLCYHNHAFEFRPLEGTTILEVLMDRFDKDLVGLELDVFWSAIAGVDTLKIFKKYAGRIPLVHLKDKARGDLQTYSEDVPPHYFKEAGEGTLDFEALLTAAHQAVVQHYIVEQDQCPGDPLESLQKSFKYLARYM
jgi:sugar phosphate isomerase/epimerase